MTTTLTNNYEGLFLLPQSAGSDLGGATELVKGLLDKVGAEIISFKKWDERRLAYELKGNKPPTSYAYKVRDPSSPSVSIVAGANILWWLL